MLAATPGRRARVVVGDRRCVGLDPPPSGPGPGQGAAGRAVRPGLPATGAPGAAHRQRQPATLAAPRPQGLGGVATLVAGAGSGWWHAIVRCAGGGAPLVAGATQAPAARSATLPDTDRRSVASVGHATAIAVRHFIGGHGTGGSKSGAGTATCRTTTGRISAYRNVHADQLNGLCATVCRTRRKVMTWPGGKCTSARTARTCDYFGIDQGCRS